MIRRPPRSTRTDTLFPYTTLFRSAAGRLWPRLSVTRTGLADSNLVILLSSTVAPRSKASCWVDVRTIWSVLVMSRPFSVAAAMLVRILPLGDAALDWIFLKDKWQPRTEERGVG